MSRLVVGPFNRVEGDLEVSLEIEAGQVQTAHVTAPLYRGFENMLKGRPAADALVIVPRICGICSVSQSMAAAMALRDSVGGQQPLNAHLVSNLVLAAENIADHLSHFYLFFMPDFARDIYQDRPWFGDMVRRFKAVEGEGAQAFLEARSDWLHVIGILAGKWPHTLCFQPGGVAKALEKAERVRLLSTLKRFQGFVEKTVLGGSLVEFAALSSAAELEAWRLNHQGDFSLFLTAAHDLELAESGQFKGPFLSYGAYKGASDPFFSPGLFDGDSLGVFDPGSISEDPHSSWLTGTTRHPLDGQTLPDAEREGGYSWAKAPRLAGLPVEVGAFARQLVDGHPLVRDIHQHFGACVLGRIVARLVECARLIPQMREWLEAVDVDGAFYEPHAAPDTAPGIGMVEAARGSLGHWMRLQDGKIANYQIIAPTTWNFSPRDGSGVPGPLEQALAGTPLKPGEKTPVAVQHVVRSFDPCMNCTVH